MKRSIVLAAGACLVLGGCASMNGAQRADGQYGSDVDMDKVVAVNQWAQTKGAMVVWVNLPRKSKAESSAAVN